MPAWREAVHFSCPTVVCIKLACVRGAVIRTVFSTNGSAFKTYHFDVNVPRSTPAQLSELSQYKSLKELIETSFQKVFKNILHFWCQFFALGSKRGETELKLFGRFALYTPRIPADDDISLLSFILMADMFAGIYPGYLLKNASLCKLLTFALPQ